MKYQERYSVSFSASFKELGVLFLHTVGGDKDLMNFIMSQTDFISHARSFLIFGIIKFLSKNNKYQTTLFQRLLIYVYSKCCNSFAG